MEYLREVKITFLIVLLFTSTFGFSQTFKSEKQFKKFVGKQLKIASNTGTTAFDKKISAEKCLADLRILQGALEEAQTTLYRFATKEEVNRAFQEAMTRAENGLTYLELLREIAKIQNTIACGHSWWGHHDEYFEYRTQNMKFFPFEMRYFGPHCLLFQNNSLNQEIPEDVFLLQINGEPVDSLLWRMKKYTNRDGTSMDRNLREPAKYFVNAYSNFIGRPDTFEITYFDGAYDLIYTKKIAALPMGQIDSIRTLKYPDWKKHGLPLKLEVLSDLDAAIYTIEWFRKDYIESKGQDFEVFTDSVFQVLKLKGIEKLVIDLRANTGGWTAFGKYLFSYFIDIKTPYLSKVLTNKFKDYSFEELILQDPGYLDTFKMKVDESGLWRWENYPNEIAYPQQTNKFNGQVYILTDNFTRSCSGMFCTMMREHTDAIFIGEETGATRCGAGGMVMQFKLPHSGIKVNFSTGLYVAQISDKSNSKGVIPDLPYEYFLTGSYDMKYIYELLEGEK